MIGNPGAILKPPRRCAAILAAIKVYTRRGDSGETDLFGGGRVGKDDARVCAYGEVDELNAVLGAARAELQDADLVEWLSSIQLSLFDLGSELANPDIEERAAAGKPLPRVVGAEVDEIEGWIDRLDGELEPLKSFVLPGGTRAAALLHLGRTVCRRAERHVIALSRDQSVAPLLIRYLNRLSDLLFTMARAVNRRAGVAETQWKGRER